MKKNPLSRQGSWLSLCGSLLSRTLIAACILSPLSGFSQLGGTNSQFYRLYGPRNTAWENFTDAKGFSTEVIDKTRESVMAGTLYDPNSQWGIPFFVHFLDGTTFNTNPIGGAYPDPMGSSDVVIFPDAQFYHQRVVDIAIGENNTTSQACFITVSAREDASQPGARRDQIRVIQTDYSGASSGPDIILHDTRNINGTAGFSMYPTHSLYKVVGSTKTLFICGYVTMDPTVGPATGTFTHIPTGINIALPYPDFTSTKQAFVLSIDVGGATPTLQNCRYYNWNYHGGTTNPIEYDFDMAMHMTELSANYGGATLANSRAGHIHVTGSVTAKTGECNGPNTSTGPKPFTFIRSATMNLFIDPATLNVDVFGNNPFIAMGNVDGMGKSEYGVAFVEGSNGIDNYIVSNEYDGAPSGFGPSSPSSYVTWAPTAYGGFNYKPEAFTIAHANQWGFVHSAAPNKRLKFRSGAWALQTLVSSHPNVLSSGNYDHRFVIAGMMHTDPYAPTSMILPPSDNNIIPFLFDVQPAWSNATTGSFIGNTIRPVNDLSAVTPSKFAPNEDFIAYVNQTGTGIVGTDVNNYLTMGSDFSSVLWGPTFADRYEPDVRQDYVLNAPKFGKRLASGNITSFLGLKAMFAHHEDKDIAYGGCVEKFSMGSIPEDIEGIIGTPPYAGMDYDDNDQSLFIYCGTNTPTIYNNALYDKFGDCTGLQHSPDNSPVYRTSTGIRLQNAKTTIFPNPASDALHIQLASDIATDVNVKIVLSTIQGQVVKELYNGTAEALSAEYNMSLPAVASGLYVVQVYSNNKVVHQQKLSIQQ
ncbi:MAG TPA: T9SS type A sorting domain-containing protein [Flavipsychrobacter sp.]|nr:T9SS type A sorting domain-containing protein [Flavipsychrobacter sp.]